MISTPLLNEEDDEGSVDELEDQNQEKGTDVIYTPFGTIACTINPFEHDTPVTRYEWFKIVLFSVTGIAFIRFVLAVFCLFLGSVYCFLVTIGWKYNVLEPIPKWRRLLLYPIKFICRMYLLCFGVFHIRVIGQPSDEANLVVSNHVSLFDMTLMGVLIRPAVVAKAAVLKLPFIATVLKAMQVITVDRSSPTARKDTKDSILRFSKNKAFPRLLIFPQGTTCRSDVITLFQRGAFSPGEPVQPMVLIYKFKHFNPAYGVWQKSDWFLYRHFCQFCISIEVHYLDVYKPNQDEIDDDTLYSENVRKVMATHLNVPITDHSFEDGQLYRHMITLVGKMQSELQKSNKQRHQFIRIQQLDDESQVDGEIPLEYRPINLYGLQIKHVKDLFDSDEKIFQLDDAKSVMTNFLLLDVDNDGVIDADEFNKVFNYKSNIHVFQYFNRCNNANQINIRKFMLAIYMLHPKYAPKADQKLFTFNIYNPKSNEFITAADISKISKVGNSLQESRFSYDEYSELVDKHPSLISDALVHFNNLFSGYFQQERESRVAFNGIFTLDAPPLMLFPFLEDIECSIPTDAGQVTLT